MNSFNRQTPIAALDIGSSKVCCVIARIGMLSSGDKYSGHGLRLALSE